MNKTIYMTHKKNPPDKVINQWLKYNKDYTIDFSLDKDCFDFLEENFNSYVANEFQNIKEGKYKADLWRICKLYKFNGIYSDIDIVPYFNIDILDKNINFYSCLNATGNGIFQAFIANFSESNNPLFLVFIISLLINKPYSLIHNVDGPTLDMYNCIKYILNVDTIIPEEKYETDIVKIKINIGNSNRNIKKINLYYFPNIDYTIKLHKKKNDDTFKFKIVNNILIVERIDKKEGWKQNHSIDICFSYKCSFFFFKEKTDDNIRLKSVLLGLYNIIPDSWAEWGVDKTLSNIIPNKKLFNNYLITKPVYYVGWRNKKIMDSRYSDYNSITGNFQS